MGKGSLQAMLDKLPDMVPNFPRTTSHTFRYIYPPFRYICHLITCYSPHYHRRTAGTMGSEHMTEVFLANKIQTIATLGQRKVQNWTLLWLVWVLARSLQTRSKTFSATLGQGKALACLVFGDAPCKQNPNHAPENPPAASTDGSGALEELQQRAALH